MRPIRLTVRNDGPADRRELPLTGGVPLPQGAACDSGALQLVDADGRALICQADVQARWADGSIKWLWLTVPAFSLAAGASAKLTLAASAAAARAASAATAIRITRAAVGVRVNSGRLRFTVARSGPLIPVLASCVDGRWRQRGRNLDLALAVRHGTRLVHYSAAAEDREVTIEVAGPQRAVICVRGRHRGGRRTFGPYTLRLEVIAGASTVGLTHSLTFDGDPDRDMIAASEVVMTACCGKRDHVFAFGADAGAESRFARQRARFCPDFRCAELIQDSANHWRLQRRVTPADPPVFCAEGQRADGWLMLGGSGGSLGMAVRECWQQHPKALAADAASGEVRAGLYPSSAAPLDLRRYSQLRYPWTYENPAFRCREPLPLNDSQGAHGTRKTHDLLLLADTANPSLAALALNQPLLLQWSQAHTARARPVVPVASRPVRRWREAMELYSDFLHRQMLTAGGTGYVDYFDLPHGYSTEDQRWFHDFGGWGYINDEAMPCLGLWQAYLLTGRRDVYDMARAMARHNGDFDSYMIGPQAGYGSRHNVNHWGDSCKDRRVSQPIGKRFLTYLAGDRSAVDLAHVVLASFERQAAQPKAFNMTCDIPSLVATMLFLEETGERDLRQWLLAVADAVAASVDESGRMSGLLELDATDHSAAPRPDAAIIGFMMFSCFGGAQALAELAERYEHAALRAALVRFTRYQCRPHAERAAQEAHGSMVCSDALNVFRGLDLFGYAYSLTGDTAIRDYARQHSDQLCVALEPRPAPRYGEPGGAAAEVPVLLPWPDAPPDAEQQWRQTYPLFARESAGQFFNIAVYMHKVQGAMLLA
jgi:hypothetical protein